MDEQKKDMGSEKNLTPEQVASQAVAAKKDESTK